MLLGARTSLTRRRVQTKQGKQSQDVGNFGTDALEGLHRGVAGRTRGSTPANTQQSSLSYNKVIRLVMEIRETEIIWSV